MNIPSPNARAFRVLFLIPPLLIGATAAAESAAADDEPLDEIVVTGSYTTDDKLDSATGLGLSIWETPQSVSVMTSQRILDQDLQSLSDVVINAAGVSAKELDSSRDAFSARGFPIDNYQIDGVPMEWSSGGDAGETQTDPTLYERIEIVRGATGLLTGSGNPSASINLVRKHADSREFTGFTSFGVGRWDTYSATLDLSAPLNAAGSIRSRWVMNYEDGDSHVDFLGNRKSVFYGVVDADVGSRTLLRGGFSYQDNDPTASTWGGLPSWYADGSRTDWPRSKTIGAEWTRWASQNENAFVDLEHDFGNGWNARALYNYLQNDAELVLLYLYGAPDEQTGLGLTPFPYRSDTSREQHSLDLRLTGAFGLFGRAHELTLGYSQLEQDFVTNTNPNLTAADVGNFNDWDGSYPEPEWGDRVTDIETETDQTGFYAATRLHATDALRFVLGLRLADWEETGMSYGDAVDYGDSSVVIPYAGAVYDFNERFTGYASYTEIFKPQDLKDRFGDSLPPVVGEAYEAGVKSAFFDGALHATAAIFRIDQDNLGQPDPGHLVPGTIFQAYRAAQGTTSEGYELELVGRPVEGWEISASYTNFDAEDAEGVGVNTDQPREMFKFYTTYRFQETLPDLTVGGGVNWQGENYTDTLNGATFEPERLEQDAYSLVSLMARYDFSARLSGQLNIDNLTDEVYYSQIGFYDQLAFGEPRNVTLRLRWQF